MRMNVTQNDKTRRSAASAVAGILSLALMGGCANAPFWKQHEKENKGPFPTKFEAPFSQMREGADYPKAGETTSIPIPLDEKPKVNEPDPWVPGRTTILSGIGIKGQPGFVLSPYAPDKGLVDVRGFPPGTDVRDPYTGKVMKVPLPITEEKAKEQTLQKPADDQPQLTSPPTLER